MRIAVIGSGALGLYYGALLQRAGHDLYFLLRRDYDAIMQNGLTVTSPNGDFHLPQVQGYRQSAEIGPVDLVLVGLKTFSNDCLVDLLRPLIGAETAILTLQNGLGNEELLAATFGSGRILGGIAVLCSNRGEPGTVHHLGLGAVRLGEFAGGLSPRAEALAALFCGAGIPCEAVDDLRRARWEKLVWNIPFNGLCALLGLDTAELLARPGMRGLVAALMGEVISAANRQPLTRPIDAKAVIARMLKMTDEMGPYRPSMMIDRLEGRRLELDAIYYIPLQHAEIAGADMPLVRMLVTLLAAGEPH